MMRSISKAACVGVVLFLATRNAGGGFTYPTTSTTEGGGDEIVFSATFPSHYFIETDQYNVEIVSSEFYLNDLNGDTLVASIGYDYLYNNMTDEYSLFEDYGSPAYYPNPGGNLSVELWAHLIARNANMNSDDTRFSVEFIVNGD
ncbi:MAG: hypothetical protein U0835_03885 [Isosphaeraceae bacterium]